MARGEYDKILKVYAKSGTDEYAHTCTHAPMHPYNTGIPCILLRECLQCTYKYLFKPTASLRHQFRLLATDLSLMCTIYLCVCSFVFFLVLFSYFTLGYNKITANFSFFFQIFYRQTTSTVFSPPN